MRIERLGNIPAKSNYKVGDIVAIGETAIVMILEVGKSESGPFREYKTICLVPGGDMTTGKVWDEHLLDYNTTICREVSASIHIEEDC